MRRLAARDMIAGILVVAVGGAFMLGALALPLGTVVRMGSGYFPLLAAVVTVALGVVIVLVAVTGRWGSTATPDEADGAGAEAADAPSRRLIAWRSAIAVLGGVAAFALCLPRFGFVPAVFACALLSAYADQRARPVESLATATAMAGASWLIFLVGLGIAASAFRWAL